MNSSDIAERYELFSQQQGIGLGETSILETAYKAASHAFLIKATGNSGLYVAQVPCHPHPPFLTREGVDLHLTHEGMRPPQKVQFWTERDGWVFKNYLGT